MAQVTFFDLELLNKKQVVWSPNTCKTRYALNVKNIPYETQWVNFGNIQTVIPEITKLDKRPVVPVIIDKSNGSAVLDDSYRIALHLEEKYPDSPSLFHGGIGVHDFFQNYADHHIILPIFKLVLLDICKLSGPPDLQEWFRKDRESKFGITLEEFAGDTDANVSDLKTALYPIVKLLEKSDYITGSQVGWADVVLASQFVFLEALKPELFEAAVLDAFGKDDKTLISWWIRMEKYRKGCPSPNL